VQLYAHGGFICAPLPHAAVPKLRDMCLPNINAFAAPMLLSSSHWIQTLPSTAACDIHAASAP
jgi:hypothetical protein